jgi:hypothetical protein
MTLAPVYRLRSGVGSTGEDLPATATAVYHASPGKTKPSTARPPETGTGPAVRAPAGKLLVVIIVGSRIGAFQLRWTFAEGRN